MKYITFYLLKSVQLTKLDDSVLFCWPLYCKIIVHAKIEYFFDNEYIII